MVASTHSPKWFLVVEFFLRLLHSTNMNVTRKDGLLFSKSLELLVLPIKIARNLLSGILQCVQSNYIMLLNFSASMLNDDEICKQAQAIPKILHRATLQNYQSSLNPRWILVFGSNFAFVWLVLNQSNRLKFWIIDIIRYQLLNIDIKPNRQLIYQI